jgi:hypothetical protein
MIARQSNSSPHTRFTFLPVPAERLASWFLASALAVSAFSLALVTRADADLWGHLRFGLDLIETGRLIAVDPYSFTQDTPWINHEWLSELQMAWAYRAGGLPGLLLLKGAIVWIVFAIVWLGLRGIDFRVRLAAMLLLVIGTIHMTSTVRPQLWSFLCLTLLCYALTSDRPGVRWWLPLLFAFWVNCHGGWIVGLGVVGVWAAGAIWHSPAAWRHWAAVTAASLAATLVNPYGIGLWEFIASTVRLHRQIDEWRPLWHAPALNWVPWIVAVIGTVWAVSRRTSGWRPAGAVLLMLAYASARVMRIESLFVVAAALLLAPALRERWPGRIGLAASHGLVAGTATLLILAIPAAGLLARRAVACVPIRGGWAPDLEAMAALKHARSGRIVTPFNWGQYAIWHLSPGVRVSMDGRRETVYSDTAVETSRAVFAGRAEGLAALADWRAEYVWLPAESERTAGWLEANGYRLEVATPRSKVAVRGDLPALPAPSPAGSVRPCFPG